VSAIAVEWETDQREEQLVTVATRDEKNRLTAAGWTAIGYGGAGYVLTPAGTAVDGAP
jgi:hypothetical protein